LWLVISITFKAGVGDCASIQCTCIYTYAYAVNSYYVRTLCCIYYYVICCYIGEMHGSTIKQKEQGACMYTISKNKQGAFMAVPMITCNQPGVCMYRARAPGQAKFLPGAEG